MKNIISIHTLTKLYKNHVVLKDISLEIQRGEIFSLVGVNGAGKTTLIKCLLDFHKADSGEIEIAGKSSLETSARNHLAYLPERFVPPYYLNGKQFINYILELHNVDYDEESVNTILNIFDLPLEVLKKSVKHYSKGMAQKLGLATLFLLNKKLYVFDEPMSGLDPKARVLVKSQINLQKQKGNTIFFSSHLLADVDELSDRLAILHKGKIAFCGTPDECKQQYKAESLEQAFLNCIE